jgi:hypothetical protein
MTATQTDKANQFRSLHEAAEAFVIANVWDGGSARMMAALGFPALATSSAVRPRVCWVGVTAGSRVRSADAGSGDLRCHRFAGLGGPGKGLWRCAGSCGGNHQARGGSGTGRLLD